MTTKSLLYDRQIIKRVELYLEKNVQQTKVTAGQLTRELMQIYPEYKRRRFGPFCKLVLHAFHIVSNKYGINQEKRTHKPASNATDIVADSAVSIEKPKPNLMSGMMNSLYNKPVAAMPQAKPPPESIDILSSDESSDESAAPKAASNGKVEVGEVAVKQPKVDSKVSVQKRIPATVNPVGEPIAKKSKVEQNMVTVQNPRLGGTQEAVRKLQNALFPEAQPSDEDANSNASENSRQQRKRRNYNKEIRIRKPEHKFEEIGGMENTLKELCELLINIKSPDIYFQLGLMPPRGILLHGPTGCGKTLLAEAIAGQLHLPFIEVAATELIAGVSGESEERIRDIFDQASDFSPCVLFIDEIDTISSNRSFAQKEMERRIVSQLISSLDDLKNSDDGQSVLVIGATTRPDVLDPALRRFGRFDHEIQISIPTRKGRKDILKILSRGMAIEPALDFDKIAELTPGYVGADLYALLTRAASIAVKRKCTQNYRNLEAKAHRVMDIVNLDDDESETTAKKGSVEPTDEQQSTTDVDMPEVPEVPKEKDSDDAQVKENKGDVVDIDDDATAVTTSKNAEKSENTVNTHESTCNVDTSTLAVEVVPTSSGGEVYEPTLRQLTNWLENPPDDFNDPDFCITFGDFISAIKVVQPSAKREGFITVPDVTWDDIGSLQDIRDELKLAVLAPVKYPEKLARLGLSSPSGVLLCGPPGCGKTLLAKAIANEAGINFISVKGPELMNMYVGESERAVRACFQRARNSSPCVIFFDEFDSLCPKRSDGNESGSGTRIVNQLLTEMDGVEDRKGVYVLAATNRPDIIDPAILRPGRLDTILYVGLPQEQDRVEILKATTKNGKRPALASDVDLSDLASKTDGYTGADLAGLVKQASMLALRDSLKQPDLELDDLNVHAKNFEDAINLLRPSVSLQDRKVYEKLRLKYAAPRIPSFPTEE